MLEYFRQTCGLFRGAPTHSCSSFGSRRKHEWDTNRDETKHCGLQFLKVPTEAGESVDVISIAMRRSFVAYNPEAWAPSFSLYVPVGHGIIFRVWPTSTKVSVVLLRGRSRCHLMAAVVVVSL